MIRATKMTLGHTLVTSTFAPNVSTNFSMLFKHAMHLLVSWKCAVLELPPLLPPPPSKNCFSSSANKNAASFVSACSVAIPAGFPVTMYRTWALSVVV